MESRTAIRIKKSEDKIQAMRFVEFLYMMTKNGKEIDIEQKGVTIYAGKQEIHQSSISDVFMGEEVKKTVRREDIIPFCEDVIVSMMRYMIMDEPFSGLYVKRENYERMLKEILRVIKTGHNDFYITIKKLRKMMYELARKESYDTYEAKIIYSELKSLDKGTKEVIKVDTNRLIRELYRHYKGVVSV